MSDAIVWVLLSIGVAAQLSGVLGILVARSVFDRLHLTGPASIFGPSCLALAVVIDEGPFSQAGLKSLLAAARPARTDYFFFVRNPGDSGEHAFSETQAEFDRDVARYQASREP